MGRVGRHRGVVILLGVAVLWGGCGGESPSPDGPRFVTTIPPFEMILTPLVAGRGTVERLLAPGASPHTYDPTPSDLRATTDATALIYGAEHLDGWAATLPASRRLALTPLLPSRARLSFGREGAGAGRVDPHFWTDPTAVQQLVPVLADTLCAMDPAGCSTYRANADSFVTALATLDSQLRPLMRPMRDVPVLLAQPFFRYFLRRYGPRLVEVVEPQPGAEATPRRLHRLVERARNAGAQAILTQQSLSDRSARAVAEASRIPVVSLDPLGGTEGRRTYEALLQTNARILHDSLTALPAP